MDLWLWKNLGFCIFPLVKVLIGGGLGRFLARIWHLQTANKAEICIQELIGWPQVNEIDEEKVVSRVIECAELNGSIIALLSLGWLRPRAQPRVR